MSSHKIKSSVPLHAATDILEHWQGLYGGLLMAAVDEVSRLKQQYDMIEEELEKRRG